MSAHVVGAFTHAVRDRTPHAVPIADVLHGMAVLDAIVRDGASGRIEPVIEPTTPWKLLFMTVD